MAAFVLSYAKQVRAPFLQRPTPPFALFPPTATLPQIAEGHAKVSVKDWVITVPPFFGHLERHALLAHAKLRRVALLLQIAKSSSQ